MVSGIFEMPRIHTKHSLKDRVLRLKHKHTPIWCVTDYYSAPVAKNTH